MKERQLYGSSDRGQFEGSRESRDGIRNVVVSEDGTSPIAPSARRPMRTMTCDMRVNSPLEHMRLSWRMLIAWAIFWALSPAAFTQACPIQDGGGDDQFDPIPFKLYRPTDHQVFPAGTRAVSVIGTKPIGPTALLRIQDPHGNLVVNYYPAIRTFFNAVLDNGGVALLPGEWEATLCDGLEPLRAIDHIHFVIEAGDPAQAFPTIDVPAEGEVYPGNMPFIDFVGVASPDSTVWLRVYRVSTQQQVFEVELNETIGFMWGYATMWGLGPGEYLAGVAPTSAEVSDYLSDSTTFTVQRIGDDDWPHLMPFKFLW